MIIPFQIDSVNGSDGNLENITVKISMALKTLSVDFFLPFFGLSTDLGPIKRLGLRS